MSHNDAGDCKISDQVIIKYFLKITHNAETAVIVCDSLEDATIMKKAFENYSKYDSIEILTE